jgi:ATP-dependent protease ClpP protease subunit
VKATVTSFGFSKGVAPDTDFRVDVRFMESPPWPLCRADGTDPDVSAWVLEHGSDFFAAWELELEAIVAGAGDRGIEELTIGVGCNLGRHRSVATTARTGEILSDLGVDVTVEHRELGATSEEASAMARQFPKARGAFYEIRAAARAESEPAATDLWIYDVIGDDWFDESLTAKELCQRIAAIDTPEIVLHLSTPGGSVSDGLAIYNALVSHPAKVTSRIEGWTASMGTVLALAGETVAMYDNALFMIHWPQMVCVGNADELRERADWLDRVGAIMAGIYMGRCTKTEDELAAALSAETYLDAGEALEWGFVTEVVAGQQAAAVNRCVPGAFEALGFTHVTSEFPAPDPALVVSGDASCTLDSKALAAIRLASPRH